MLVYSAGARGWSENNDGAVKSGGEFSPVGAYGSERYKYLVSARTESRERERRRREGGGEGT